MSISFSHGYAVIVGVGADLPVTVQDAQALAEILQDDSRGAYPPDQVRLLTGPQARRDEILAALSWLAARAGPEDTALVYFSGHGVETPDYYLAPYGFEWDDLAATAISGVEFTDLLGRVGAGRLIVLLDCCHAGGQAEAKRFIKSPMPAGALEELGRSRGRVIIASSRKDELSWTGEPHSQFTLALLEGLAGYGAFERDGLARILDIALYVGRQVPNRTADRQHPIIKVKDLQDNFAVAWYAGGSSQPKALPWLGSAALPWGAGAAPPRSAAEAAQATSWRRMLDEQRFNLLLIDERMSEYVEYTAIPLDLVKNRRRTEQRIAELEARLGER
jgi:hypothetical protein